MNAFILVSYHLVAIPKLYESFTLVQCTHFKDMQATLSLAGYTSRLQLLREKIRKKVNKQTK